MTNRRTSMQIVKIKGLKGAQYNPRHISEESFQMLLKSIEELGIIKPVIVRAENSTLIAGHRRTEAMKVKGYEETPAYVLKNLNYADEVRFNQMHNACEIEVSPLAPSVRINGELKIGEFQRIKNSQIEVLGFGKMSNWCNVLSKLIQKYGEFGCPICTPDGTVRISAAYAYAAKVAGADIDLLCLPDDKAARAVYYLSQKYGEFCYDHLEKKTHHQRFAQKKRLRDGRKGEANSNKSFLYEKYILPYLADKPKTLRILDFGAGQKDYAKKLTKLGFKVMSVDPYHMKKGSTDIDIQANAQDFRAIAADIEKNGLYDVVICDSVLNSVDSMEAEKSVVHTVYGLCRMGGQIFISGRNFEAEEKRARTKIIKTEDSLIRFYDENHFSGIFRNGEWFYQKYHTKQDIHNIASLMSSSFEVHFNSQAFEICALKNRVAPLEDVIAGLRFEWNLPLPGGFRYGLSNVIEKSYRYACNRTNEISGH